MQADTCFIGYCDQAEYVANTLGCQQIDDRLAQSAAYARTLFFRIEVNRQLGIPRIRRTLADAVGVGVSRELASCFGDDVGVAFHGIAHSLLEFRLRGRLGFERDGGGFDIRGVDGENAFCVVDAGGSQNYASGWRGHAGSLKLGKRNDMRFERIPS